MADGLSAEQAARAVGVPRATLSRWEKKPEPESRRPHRLRKRQWTHEMVRAVEDLRNDNPMWGKRKIAVLLRREGVCVSVSTVGRILAHLVKRGAVLAALVCAAGPRPGASASPPRRVTPAAWPRAARPTPRANSSRSTRSS
jgi:putative transposase